MDKTLSNISIIAKNYADALVEIARKSPDGFDKVREDLDTVCQVFQDSADFNTAMLNPSISDEVKFEITDSVFSGHVSSEIVSFLKVLIQKKRVGEFGQIVEAYREKLNEIGNIYPVTIISAIELSADKRATVVEKLTAKLGGNVCPTWEVDEEIVGGLIFKINDSVVDMSLKTRIDKLGKTLK